MKLINVIIGANFGDEGKGMMTHYYSNSSKELGMSVLNVLYNGGVQRGHTANNHVYHCFGSGTSDGAKTYYDNHFIVDPVGFMLEKQQIGYSDKIFVNKNCRISTPYDMVLNQKKEELRGKDRHGSCGMGIYESRKRSEDSRFALYPTDLFDNNRLKSKLDGIYHEWYSQETMKLCGNNSFPDGYADIFMNATSEFIKNIIVVDSAHEVFDNFDSVIFEGGQGLLLDEDNIEYYPNLTPSHTGLKDIFQYLDGFDGDKYVSYVTRSYMTRHGAGRFDTECSKSIINPDIVDKTNIPNDWQETLRFGLFDKNLLTKSVEKDLSVLKNNNYCSRLCVTQLNYTNDLLASSLDKSQWEYPSSLKGLFDEIITFNHEYI